MDVPWPWLVNGDEVLGAAEGSVWGTYLYGRFGNDAVQRVWLASLYVVSSAGAWEERVEREIDRVAGVVEESLDMDLLKGLVGEEGRWR